MNKVVTIESGSSAGLLGAFVANLWNTQTTMDDVTQLRDADCDLRVVNDDERVDSVKESRFLVHQGLLCRSPVLKEVLVSEEARRQTMPGVVLAGFRTSSVVSLLQFLYTGRTELPRNAVHQADFLQLCQSLAIDPKVDETKSSNKPAFKCEHCTKGFKSAARLASHVQRRHQHQLDSEGKNENLPGGMNQQHRKETEQPEELGEHNGTNHNMDGKLNPQETNGVSAANIVKGSSSSHTSSTTAIRSEVQDAIYSTDQAGQSDVGLGFQMPSNFDLPDEFIQGTLHKRHQSNNNQNRSKDEQQQQKQQQQQQQNRLNENQEDTASPRKKDAPNTLNEAGTSNPDEDVTNTLNEDPTSTANPFSSTSTTELDRGSSRRRLLMTDLFGQEDEHHNTKRTQKDDSNDQALQEELEAKRRRMMRKLKMHTSESGLGKQKKRHKSYKDIIHAPHRPKRRKRMMDDDRVSNSDDDDSWLVHDMDENEDNEYRPSDSSSNGKEKRHKSRKKERSDSSKRDRRASRKHRVKKKSQKLSDVLEGASSSSSSSMSDADTELSSSELEMVEEARRSKRRRPKVVVSVQTEGKETMVDLVTYRANLKTSKRILSKWAHSSSSSEEDDFSPGSRHKLSSTKKRESSARERACSASGSSNNVKRSRKKSGQLPSRGQERHQDSHPKLARRSLSVHGLDSSLSAEASEKLAQAFGHPNGKGSEAIMAMRFKKKSNKCNKERD